MEEQETQRIRTAAGEKGGRRFSVHVAWTLGARLLMAANSVLAGVIIARWLGAVGFGAFAVLNAAVGNAVQFGGAGITSANTYFIARERQLFVPAALNGLIYSLTAGGLLACAVLLLGWFVPALFDGVPAGLIAVAAITIPSQLLILLGLNLFLVVGKVGHYSLLDLLGQSFILINAVLALVCLRAGLLALVSLNTAASAACGLLVVCLVYRFIRQEGDRIVRGPDAGLFRRMVRYGLKYNILMAAATLVLRADLLIVNSFRGPAEAGVYALASQSALLLLLLPNVIGSLLFPRVARLHDTEGEVSSVVARHTAFVMLLVCLAAVPACFALPVLYGEAFADAPVQFLILLPGAYLLGLEMVLVQHFVGTGLPRMVLGFWLATLAVGVLLNLALVPRFGARGAALASSVSYTLIFVLVAFYFGRKTNKSFRSMLLISRPELRGLMADRRVSKA